MLRFLCTSALFLCLSIAFAQEEIMDGGQNSTDSSNFHFTQVDELIRSYQFHKAIVQLEEYLNDMPDDTDALLRLATCHHNLGNLPKARAKYQEILQIDSTDVVAANRLATIFMKEKAYNQAKFYFSRLVRIDSTNSYYYKKLADIDTRLGYIDQAIKLYNTALQYNPDDLESMIALSGIYVELIGDFPELEEKYLDVLHRGFQLDSLNRALLEIKARHAFKSKNYRETVNTLDLIFQNYADTLNHFAGLAGVCHLHIGNLKKAEGWFQYVIGKNDDTELTHYYLGSTYDKMEAHEKAIAHFKMAIEKGISENMFNYYVSLAGAYESINQLGESIRAYQEAYQYNRQDMLLYKLARNYDAYYEDKRPAILYYQKFLDQSATDSPYAAYANRRISELSEYLHVIDTLN